MGCGIRRYHRFSDRYGVWLGDHPNNDSGDCLGFCWGLRVNMVPLLLRSGLDLKSASKITLATETASIVVMETAENGTAFLIPGLLIASFVVPLFWVGFVIAIIAGFIAAYPVNYFMISRKLKGAHIHH